MKIKELPKVDRPREKLEKYGPDKLSDAELFAIILGTGSRGINAVELSKKILAEFKGSPTEVGVAELKNFSGLGAAKASRVVASFELGRRMLLGKQGRIFLTPKEVWNELPDIRTKKKEYFVVLFLDTKNQEINRELISIGTLNQSLIHPREVFEPAVVNHSAHIIIAHNHPSGSVEPSEEDQRITVELVEAGKLLGIEVLDHIIVTKSDYFSMRENNCI